MRSVSATSWKWPKEKECIFYRPWTDEVFTMTITRSGEIIYRNVLESLGNIETRAYVIYFATPLLYIGEL